MTGHSSCNHRWRPVSSRPAFFSTFASKKKLKKIVVPFFRQVVEFVLVDEGVTFDASHPMHLHGHSFRVVALEKLGPSTSVQEVIALDRAG